LEVVNDEVPQTEMMKHRAHPAGEGSPLLVFNTRTGVLVVDRTLLGSQGDLKYCLDEALFFF